MQPSEGTLSFLNRQLKLNSASEAEGVVQEIERFRPLLTLDLQGNTLGVAAGARIARALSTHPELQKCHWSDIFTGRLKTEIPPIMKSLCSAMISANCQITELDLSDNAFGPIGADGIADFLISPSAFTLTTLKLNNNGLGAGGKRIAQCLKKCYYNAEKLGKKFALKHFIAGRNRLEDPGAEALSQAFVILKSLETIKIPQNGIRSSGITSLARAFEANRNLRVIDVNDNTCTANGAVEISHSLTHLKNLVVLDLGDSLCRDAGVMAIVTTLANGYYPNLEVVNLSGNEITADVAEEVIEVFRTKELTHVKTVVLSSNNFGSQFSELREMAEGSQIDIGESDDDQGSLSELESDGDEETGDYGELGADDESMEEEASVVYTEDSVAHGDKKAKADDDPSILLSEGFGCMKVDDSCGILSFLDQNMKITTAAEAEAVAKKIERTKCVKTLELRGNTIGVEAGHRLAEALESHPELQRCLWSDLFTSRLKTEIPLILKGFGSAMIRAQCHITELDLSDNAFGPVGAEGIRELLQSPVAYTLEVLKLNNNGLGSGGVIIANSLAECHARSLGSNLPLRLKTFIAGRNRLENPGAIALANTFKKLGTLETIEMPQNGISQQGIEALADALKFNPDLRVFNVNDNTTTQIGAFAIAQNLKHLTKLEVLDLGDCLCRDAGCHNLVDALSPAVHKYLKEVNLSGDEMSAAAAVIIIDKWAKFSAENRKVKLLIGFNNFGSAFDDIMQNAIGKDVDVGNSDDDCGSCRSDSEEHNSGSESEDDESEIDVGTNNDEYALLVKKCETAVEELEKNYECRVQESSARVLLQLSDLVAQSRNDPATFQKALALAEDVVKRVSAVSRQPIPPTTQLINNCVAQCGFVKPETPWGIAVDKVSMSRLLRGLLERGHLQRERDMVLHFFKGYADG